MSDSGTIPFTLNILLVDDKPKSLHPQKKQTLKYAKAKKISLQWLEETGEKKAKKIYEILKTQNIDILILDNNINTSVSGLSILKKVRKTHDLTDILFYSADEESENLQKAESFRFTEVVPGREFFSTLTELIDKNMLKWNNFIFLRGIIISKIIDLELKLNTMFESYFEIPKHRIPNFHNLIMESGQNSLDVKRRAIMKILEEEKWTDKFSGFSNLSDLQCKRNQLAHGKIIQNDKKILCVNFLGKDTKFNKKSMDQIIVKINNLSHLLDDMNRAILNLKKKSKK